MRTSASEGQLVINSNSNDYLDYGAKGERIFFLFKFVGLRGKSFRIYCS